MRMIPEQPFDNSSKAELDVFDRLRRAFTGANQNTWFAMHSLNLPRHEYKRFGEIDFVVCGPDGIFVLEVKGGKVSCHDGVWETTNRFGETSRLKESPFRQAEGALHGLLQKLPHALTSNIVVGYGVIIPGAERLPEGAEWDRNTLIDARDFRQFEKSLGRVIKHWHGKNPRKHLATPEQLRALRQHLRPDFEAIMPLHISAAQVEQRIVHATQDQLKLIDIAATNPRVLCSGGAGTGKTMLAIELAKRWTAAGKTVALACYSPWLKGFLESQRMPGLTVTLAKHIRVTAKRAGIDQFDALIVDEGQDLLDMDTLGNLENYIRSGLDGGQWCFFHDTNNQSGLCGQFDPDALEYLQDLGAIRIPLTTNCRNTEPILKHLQQTLDADMGTSGVGDGPVIRQAHAPDADEATRLLAEELEFLQNSAGFAPGDIVILSRYPFAESRASALSSEMLGAITVLDDASPRNMQRQMIGFAEIENFKGLESEVVVLIDMPPPGHDHTLRAKHYVGMSRARALLSTITRDRTR